MHAGEQTDDFAKRITACRQCWQPWLPWLRPPTLSRASSRRHRVTNHQQEIRNLRHEIDDCEALRKV